jgi:putative membrane protein
MEDWLLVHYQAPSYAFFGGLVLASIIFPWRSITRRSWREVCACMLACVLTVGLSASVSDSERIEKEERKQSIAAAAETEQGVDPVRMLVIFGAAVLAISAMVLPGISGSFILLLLGVYFDILSAINQRDVLVLGVFALGALVGLLVFSRIIGWFLHRFFNVTMAFMIGLMLGSLYELWPFKGAAVVGDTTIMLGNTLEGIGAGQWGVAAISALVGFAIVLAFALLGGHENEVAERSVS